MELIDNTEEIIRLQSELSLNLKNGEGVIKTPDGVLFKGKFNRHSPKFKGKIIYKGDVGNQYGMISYKKGGSTKLEMYKRNCLTHPYPSKTKGHVPIGTEYEGDLYNLIPHGKGTQIFPVGDKYVGQFNNGVYEGKGTYTTSDGEKVSGQFKNGKLEGEGMMTFSDGTTYKGFFKQDKRHGYGTQTYKYENGDTGKYVGQFKDDKKHGHGTRTVNGQSKLTGEWKNGYPNGEMTEFLGDDIKIVGKFQKNENPKGRCLVTYLETGFSWEGNFTNYKWSGKGYEIFPDGTKVKGEFNDRKFNYIDDPSVPEENYNKQMEGTE